MFVPLTFERGKAFRFDRSEDCPMAGGIYCRAQVAHMKLCASSAFCLVACPSQGHEMMFVSRKWSFAALGGIPRRGIYEFHVHGGRQGQECKGRVVNVRFAVMRSHYLFDADSCNVASGREKGVVEKNVQNSRRRVWIEAARPCFSSFAELNAWLGPRYRVVCEEVRHPEHGQFSVPRCSGTRGRT